MRFVANDGRPTENYPANHNGSPDGLSAVTTANDRFTVLMLHPERVFRNVQMSWTSGDTSARCPWMRTFGNAGGGGACAPKRGAQRAGSETSETL
jgi:phosphoribosylformylglycinamidine synthase